MAAGLTLTPIIMIIIKPFFFISFSFLFFPFVTQDIHALILGKAITGIQAFEPKGNGIH